MMFAHPSVVRYVLRTEVAEHQEPTAKALMVLPFLVFSCSQRDFDSVAEGQKLLRWDAEWADLATAGKDIEKIVSYWSDDAVLIFPGQPVLEGKAAIRAYVTASLNTPGFKIEVFAISLLVSARQFNRVFPGKLRKFLI
jgi:SnoaL-like domain